MPCICGFNDKNNKIEERQCSLFQVHVLASQERKREQQGRSRVSSLKATAWCSLLTHTHTHAHTHTHTHTHTE